MIFDVTITKIIRTHWRLCKEIQPVHSKGDQSWVFSGRTDAKAETSNTLATSWEELTHWKRLWCWEGLGQEEKGTTEDEMAVWHHWLNGRESEWTPGVGDGQGGLACCDSWGHKESDTAERLIWSDLMKVKVKSLSRVQLCDPMDCSLPGSSVHGDCPGKNTQVGCRSFLQGIFPTQGSNLGLPHWRQTL